MSEKQFDVPRMGLPDTKLCPHCGLPNKSVDTKCGYCETPLRRPDGLPPGEWLKLYFSRVKWNWRLRKTGKNNPRVLGKGPMVLVGTVLCVIGGVLLASSVFTKNFSNGVLSLFFLLYGISALKGLKKK